MEKKVPEKESFFGYAQGELIAIEEVKDETFANKVLGDGVAVIPSKPKSDRFLSFQALSFLFASPLANL